MRKHSELKMSSSVDLQRKLKHLEAKLVSENEARKMDHLIDWNLESPKPPRQRPGKIDGRI